LVRVTAIAALAAAICAVHSCSSFGPPPPELRELLGAPPCGAAAPLRDTWRAQGRVEIDSRWISGDYEAVVVAETAPFPRARLQLFPALGGKLMDVLATPKRLAGTIPAAGIALDWSSADGAPPRALLAFVALGLLEQVQPLTWPRARAARRDGDGWELELEPCFPGVEQWALIDGQGELRERRYRVGGASWTERFGPHRFEGRGFRLTIDAAAAPRTADVPESAFDLNLDATGSAGTGNAP
jgi:hypothetical protein